MENSLHRYKNYCGSRREGSALLTLSNMPMQLPEALADAQQPLFNSALSHCAVSGQQPTWHHPSSRLHSDLDLDATLTLSGRRQAKAWPWHSLLSVKTPSKST